MITEETKAARRFIARYISGVITNIMYDEDVRREAKQDGIDPDEAVSAVSYWQDRLSKWGVE